MRNETFYSTMAQVLPALLIVLIIEIRAVLSKYSLAISRQHDISLNPSASERDKLLVDKRVEILNKDAEEWGRRYTKIFFLFTAGELGAVLPLLFGTEEWWFAIPCGVVVVLAVVWLCWEALRIPRFATEAVKAAHLTFYNPPPRGE